MGTAMRLARSRWPLVTGLAIGLVLGACDGEGDDDPCADLAQPCSVEGQERCAAGGASTERCGYDAGGCLGWRPGLSCTAPEVCVLVDGAATCSVGCQDMCDTLGDTRCEGTVLLTCTGDASGCLDWAFTQECVDLDPPQVCARVAGVSACAAPEPEDCDDAQDNDGDFLTDCQDPDCQQECGPEVLCDDWVDNDGDRLFDCADPTGCADPLAPDPGCVPVEAWPAGSACTASSQCRASAFDPLCLSEERSYYPAGYCSEFCQLAADDCPADAACVDQIGLAELGLGLCMRVCDPQAPDCRADTYELPGSDPVTVTRYVCANPQGSAAFVCLQNESAWEWSCADGVDNDSDGLTDCEQDLCSTSPPCQCHAGNTLTGTGSPAATGDLELGGGQNSGTCGGDGNEAIYCFRPSQAGIYRLDTLGSAEELDTVLYARGPEGELACNDDIDHEAGIFHSALTLDLAAGETVTVYVDTLTFTMEGSYHLNISLVGK